MKFLFYQLELLSAVSSPYSEAFCCTIIHFQPTLLRPPLILVSQLRMGQKSASVRLNFNCSQFIVASDTCPSSPIIYMVVTSF